MRPTSHVPTQCQLALSAGHLLTDGALPAPLCAPALHSTHHTCACVAGAQVVALALNSGFVARPTGYARAGAAAGLTLWLPTPPAGYAALGCLATPGPDAPPVAAGACVHTAALVAAPLGDFLLLKQARRRPCPPCRAALAEATETLSCLPD